ncbi:MAG TPA: hypothetical protein DCK95_05055 [Anaerolineaceae bacterium]|nr:hypothetical protein [Anaerolineaceae bacterium]
MPDQTISKTDFLLFCDCPRHFWAAKHGYPSAQPFTAMDQFRMQQGQEVEALALEFIQQHILPQYSNAELHWQHTDTLDIFLARSDALIHDEKEDCYDLYEIKSSTSLQKEHVLDVAFQREVFSASMRLRHACLVHLNSNYHRKGELDLAQLFVCEDITQAMADVQPTVAILMRVARQALQQNSYDNLEHCRKPNDCPYPQLCHPDLPQHPIYEISRLHKNKATQMEDMGVRAINDIPAGFALSEKQQAYVDVVKSGEPSIERNAIRNWFAQLRYPLHFLDYETCNPALPAFDGYKPNQHIVFQYSLHVLPAPDAELKHYEYLHTQFSDPAPALLQQLSQHIAPYGSVMVWNKAFEMYRNREMAEICPSYAQFLEELNSRVVDLMEVFSQNMYIHPDFHGSASIKKVLQVLVPDLSYADLAIQKGDEASITWWEMVGGKIIDSERQKTITNLLQYCALDTRALVEISSILTNLLTK